MTTLTRLNSDMGDILLTNLNTPAQDCAVTIPVVSGKSAYDLAVENGYVGSLQDWLASLSGWKPVDSDFANYLEQHLQLSSLFNGINSKIETNKAELDARIEERISEARAISTKLENEAQERIKAANELAKQLLDETAQRVSDASKLRDDLQSEAYERALAMDQLADDILSEQVTRVNELKDLGDFIDSMDSKVNSNHTYLLEHYSTTSTTTSEIANKIDALKTTYIDPALNTKATVTAVEQVQTNISRIDGELVTVGSKLDGVIAESGKNKQDIAAVWTDMRVRVEAESALSTRIDNVVATTYDHDARIVAETKARTDADSAMASDIRAITARVGTTEGKITSLEEVTTTTNSSLSQVSTKLDNLVTVVDGKASSQALNDVSSRVSNAEGTLTSQGQSISKLTNDLDTTNNTVNTKASADSVSALTNRVSDTEGKVTSNSNALTALTNRVTTTEGDIAKKADASALVDYYTKTKADEAIAGEIRNYDANLKIGGTNLYHESLLVAGYLLAGAGVPGGTLPDAHDPNYYPCKPNEKFAGTFYDLNGVTSQGGAGYLCFYDADKNFISGTAWIVRDVFKTTYITAPLRTAFYRYATHAKGVKAKLEYGTKATDWSPSDIDIKKTIDVNASAISGLTTRVTTAEGNITSQGTSITNLQNSISTINNSLSTKADSSALSSLDNKVTSIDGRVTTNANSITSLQGSVETINGTLTTKANSSALNNYYTKQDSDSAIAGKISEFKTNYVLPELGKKFDASAINAYYNKADTESAITSKIDSFKANYVDTELNKKFNASAITDYYTIAKANEAMTNKIDSFNSSLVIGSRNLALNTDKVVNAYYWGINTTLPLIVGKEYTISFDYIGNPTGWLFLNNSISKSYPATSTTTWVRVAITFVFVKNDYGSKELYPHVYGASQLKNMKLELGNKATDWTPAPEDINQKIAETNANITNNYYTKTQANEAIASQTSDIRTTVGNHTTSIQQHSESINGIKANWTLRLNSNGRISGMTLMNDGTTSEFAIEADNFYVGAIDSAYKPFQVKTVGWTGVDGRSYPSGVYINNAIIGDLDAKVIRAGTITGDKIQTGSITADRIQIGSLGRDRLDNNFVNTVDTAYSTAGNVSTAVKNISNWDGVSNTLTISRNNISGSKDLANLWTNQLFDPAFPIFANTSISVWSLRSVTELQGSNGLVLRGRHNIGDWKTKFYVKPGEQYHITFIGYNYSGVGFYAGLWVTDDSNNPANIPEWRDYVECKQVGETGGSWKLWEAVYTVPNDFNPSIPLAARAHFFLSTYDYSVDHVVIGNLVIKKVIKESGIDPQLVDRSKQAKQMVDDIVSDNKITPDEKQTLLVTYKQIANDNDIWRNQAYLLGLDYSRQINAMNTVLSGSRPYLGWVCRSDALTQTDTLNAGERTTLMNAISEYHAANQDLAQRVGSNLRTTGQSALSTANSANSRIDSLINEINNDNILTATEKSYLYDRWLEIIRVNNQLNYDLSNIYGDWMDKANQYDQFYNQVQSLISNYVAPNLNSSTDISSYSAYGTSGGAAVRETMYRYYAGEEEMRVRMTRNVKVRADNASGVAADARDLLNRWKANGNGTLYIDDNSIAVNLIGANQIAAGAVTANKISVSSLDAISANLGSIQVGNANIQNGAITSLKIGTAQVDTLQIAGEAVVVPRARYNPNTIQVKGNGDKVSLLSASLDTIGNVVSISLGFERIHGKFTATTTATFSVYISVYRNSTELKVYKIEIPNEVTDSSFTPNKIDMQLLAMPVFLDTPPSGTNVYEVFVNWGGSSSSVKNESIKLVGASIQLLGVKR